MKATLATLNNLILIKCKTTLKMVFQVVRVVSN